jgi:hypothetical protein
MSETLILKSDEKTSESRHVHDARTEKFVRITPYVHVKAGRPERH